MRIERKHFLFGHYQVLVVINNYDGPRFMNKKGHVSEELGQLFSFSKVAGVSSSHF